jgi:hypothetical protein
MDEKCIAAYPGKGNVAGLQAGSFPGGRCPARMGREVNPPSTVVSVDVMVGIVLSNPEAKAIDFSYRHRAYPFVGYALVLVAMKSRLKISRLSCFTGECLNSDFFCASRPQMKTCTTAATLIARLAAPTKRLRLSTDAFVKELLPTIVHATAAISTRICVINYLRGHTAEKSPILGPTPEGF